VASIDKRKGAWRVQVRRGRRSWNKTFRMKADGEAWAREIERAADRGVDPLASRITTKDSFALLINRHMDDPATYGKPVRGAPIMGPSAAVRNVWSDCPDSGGIPVIGGVRRSAGSGRLLRLSTA